MQLTAHDQKILRLAAKDAEGCLTFYIAEDGSIALLGRGETQPLPAEDSFPKLEEMGIMSREVSRTYVLTPLGWDTLKAVEAVDFPLPHQGQLRPEIAPAWF